jgi:hypothetical protein
MKIEQREISLREFSRPKTRAMLKAMTGKGGLRLVDRVFRQTAGSPALIEMTLEKIGNAPDDALLARAINARVDKLSAASRLLFAYLLTADDAVPDQEAEQRLELFEIEEPLRALINERLIRIRRTGDLLEIDVYHPTMRAVLRRPNVRRNSK